MSVGEIVFVIGLVAAFIVLIYKTMTLDPKKKPKVWPVYVRIIVIAACIGTLVLVWIIVPESSWITRIFLTVYPILYIYRALKGWLIQSKEGFTPGSTQSEDRTVSPYYSTKNETPRIQHNTSVHRQ